MNAEKELEQILSEIEKDFKVEFTTSETREPKRITVSLLFNDKKFSAGAILDVPVDTVNRKKLYGIRQDIYATLLGIMAKQHLISELKNTNNPTLNKTER